MEKLQILKPGDKAGDVSIVVYGTESVKGPIELTNQDADTPIPLIMPGKTQHFFVSNLRTYPHMIKKKNLINSQIIQ